MMLQIMAYTVAVTAVLTVVGICLERFAGLHRLSKRASWMAAMVLSVLFPIAMVLGSRAVATPDNSVFPAQSRIASAPAQAATTAAVAQRQPIWKLAAPTDRQVIAMWMVASLSFGLYLFAANFMLRRRAAAWQRTNVLGQDVLISEVTGPALLGVLRPQIVVPRWLLQQAAATQALILEHERQHMQARDPLLAVTGLFVIVAIPWNLPLWWQWRRMREAVEMDCDARVLRTGAEANSYADVLLAVTQRTTRMLPGTLAMSEPTASLERRIDCLVPNAIKHAALQTVAVLGLATLGAGVALALNAPALPTRSPASVVAVLQNTAALQPPAATPAVIARVVTTSAAKPIPRGDARLATLVAAARAQTSRDVLRSKADKILVNNDLDRNGIITREEATQANQALIFMWDQYDRNRDGQVSAAEVATYTDAVELGTAVEKLGGDAHEAGLPRKPRPELIIAISDQNADGIVTREEATKADAALNRMWHLYDLNKDDRVDAAEVAKASGYPDPNIDHFGNGGPDMNKSTLIATTVAAMGAAAVAQGQTPRTSPAEMLALNDLNKDGIVTKQEATQYNGNLYFMWVAFDMDGDGKVDLAELTRASEDLALGTALQKITGDKSGHRSAADPKLVISLNDQNGDGIVTKEEATKAGKALIRMWKSYDLNKDDKVDVAEVAKAEGY